MGHFLRAVDVVDLKQFDHIETTPCTTFAFKPVESSSP